MAILSIILIIVAFIAAVLLYRKYVSPRGSGVDRATWSWERFFQFDTLLISGIYKFLYILSLTVSVATSIIAWFSMVSVLSRGGFLTTLVGLVGGFLLAVVLFIVQNVLSRVLFESMMLQVKITENTNAIRTAMGAAPAPAPAPVQPVAPQPTPAPSDGAGASWVCPECGQANASTGAFCRRCGYRRG